MMGGLTRGLELNTFEIASEFARRIGGKCNYLAAPIYAGSPRSRDTILAQDVFRETFQQLATSDVALLSVGDLSRRSLLIRYGLPRDVTVDLLRVAGAVGDIMGTFLDSRGEPVKHALNRRVIAAPLDHAARDRHGRRRFGRVEQDGDPGRRPARQAVLGSGGRRGDRPCGARHPARYGLTSAGMYLGIDIGTSGVKAIVMDESDRPAAEAVAPLDISRPSPLWSEQAPQDWWQAVVDTLDTLAYRAPAAMSAVRGIGLSGQMLGVTLLDAADVPIRPALLWNDGRASAECAELHRRFPDFADIVGCRAMPGFPAPKISWLARHEPDALKRARRILLTKDYVRLALTGQAASDRADASATLLMDTARGDWHDDILAHCGIDRSRLPRLVESAEISGALRDELATRWHLPPGTPVAGGGGDNMCAGVGVGAVQAGSAYISLGTSGVYFVANDRFVPARGGGMHTHRHAIPGLYAQHAVVLSAGAALAWIAGLLDRRDIGSLIAETEALELLPETTPVFTPYLAGERTPHDDPRLTAAFSGLTHRTGPHHLVQAVLEGVAMALADGHAALTATGARIDHIALTGGGARSALWARLIAAAIGRPLSLAADQHAGPAIGAARLSRVAIGGPLMAPPKDHDILPVVAVDAQLREQLHRKKALFCEHAALSRKEIR